MADSTALRMRRHRAHVQGDHTLCRPGAECSSAPRRVAALEVRRLQRALTDAEGEIMFFRRVVDGVEPAITVSVERAPRELAWWERERGRLTERLRVLLAEVV